MYLYYNMSHRKSSINHMFTVTEYEEMSPTETMLPELSIQINRERERERETERQRDREGEKREKER